MGQEHSRKDDKFRESDIFSGCQAKEGKKLKPLAASKGLIVRIVLRIHMPW